MKTICFILCISVLHSVYAGTLHRTKANGNWNNPNVWENNEIPHSGDDIEIINGNSITINTDVTTNNITLTNGSATIGNYTITIRGNIDGPARNNFTTSNQTTLEITNNSAPKFVFPTGISKLKKLIMNRLAGAESSHTIALDENVPADSTVLVLTNGVLQMNGTSFVSLKNHAIKLNIPSSDSSYVDGLVQRNIKRDAGFHIFPVGQAGKARPMALEVTSGNANADNTNQVKFIYATPPNADNVSGLPGGIYKKYYWEHKLINSSNTRRRFYFKDQDFYGVSESKISDHVKLANNTGTSSWEAPTTPRDPDFVNKYMTFTNSNASNDDYWTWASTSTEVMLGDLDLPIQLINFTAIQVQDNLELAWETLTETNNNYFEVQKSNDGITYSTIASVNGCGSCNYSNTYKHIDVIENSITHYRLKQVDMNGEYTYSKSITYTPNATEKIHTIKKLKDNKYKITIDTKNTQNATCTVYSYFGQKLSEESLDLQAKYTIVDLENLSSHSVGILVISLDKYSVSEKIVFE